MRRKEKMLSRAATTTKGPWPADESEDKKKDEKYAKKNAWRNWTDATSSIGAGAAKVVRETERETTWTSGRAENESVRWVQARAHARTHTQTTLTGSCKWVCVEQLAHCWRTLAHIFICVRVKHFFFALHSISIFFFYFASFSLSSDCPVLLFPSKSSKWQAKARSHSHTYTYIYTETLWRRAVGKKNTQRASRAEEKKRNEFCTENKNCLQERMKEKIGKNASQVVAGRKGRVVESEWEGR